MSSRLNQDFIHFQGDVVTIDFTLLGIVDLDDDVTAIEWRCKDSQGATVITKTLLAGQITKKENDAEVPQKIIASVLVNPADTTSLTIGKYEHQLMVKDTFSTPRYITCSTGTMDLRPAFRS